MKKILEVLKNNSYDYYGIRGENEGKAIGEILEHSYYWDYEMDESSDEEMDGVCATVVKPVMDDNIPHDGFKYAFDTLDQAADAVINALEWHKERYGYNHLYLIGADVESVDGAFDENEIILEDAEVLFEF